MSDLEKRIEVLEDAARPRKREPFITVFECEGETLEQAEAREGVGPGDYEMVFRVIYDDAEVENHGKKD